MRPGRTARRLVAGACIVALVALGAPAAGSTPARPYAPASPAAAPVPAAAETAGIIVTLEPGAEPSDALVSSLRGRGLVPTDIDVDFGWAQAVVVSEPPDGDIAAAIEAIEALPGVAEASPNYVVHALWTPNDQYYQTGSQWPLARIQAQTAWDIERGDASVTVAVIDTGVDLDHPDLIGKIDTARDWDFIAGDAVADDDNGHGTHVAGLIAATTNNTIGIAGAAPEVRILPVKVLTSAGTGTAESLAQGINYAVAQGADIINMSLGGPAGGPVMQTAVQNAVAAGVVVVAASGNLGYSSAVFYPAAYPECLAVGATTVDDERASYSNAGLPLDVMAPGGASDGLVYSTVPYGDPPYGWKYGTSMAAPHVAAAAALLRSNDPSLTVAEIHAALEATARDLNTPGWDSLTGYGMIQMRDALDYLTVTDVTPPTVSSDVQPSYDNQAIIRIFGEDGPYNARAVRYRLDGGAAMSGGSLTTAECTTHTVEYWAEDFAGNESEVASATFVVRDTRAPLTTTDLRSTYDGPARVRIIASDGSGTGVRETFYQLDDGPVVSGLDHVVDVPALGGHVLRYRSIDTAGNEEATKTATFTVLGVPAVTRVSAANRYATAVLLSARTFAAGSVDTVVLASGEDFPDALAASGLAGAYGSPLLLTSRDRLAGGVLGEIERLGARGVVIVGGPVAVSDAVKGTLEDAGLDVRRVAGPDRYRTASAVALEMRAELGAAMPATAFVVRGDGFADALAVSPFAYAAGIPVLLTPPSALAPATRATLLELGTTEVVIAGGTTAVSDAVAAQVDALPGIATPVRRSGSNRFATAASVARFGLARGWTSGVYVGVATGSDFPDALGGGVVAGARDGVLLLTDPADLSSAASLLIEEIGYHAIPVDAYGGVGALSSAVVVGLKTIRF
ncbi:MAG: S8 family serine peptidase [Anaerosomatales bacterium]|nr:S8 family serine peptidase [Anaerosomatales bacterium]